MDKKKTVSLLIVIKNLLRAYLKKINALTQLATLEAQLAGQTLVTMVLLIFVMLFLLISTWLSFLVLLFCSLLWCHLSSLTASAIILAVNIIVSLSIYLYMRKIKKNLFFPATRKQLSFMRIIKRGS